MEGWLPLQTNQQRLQTVGQVANPILTCLKTTEGLFHGRLLLALRMNQERFGTVGQVHIITNPVFHEYYYYRHGHTMGEFNGEKSIPLFSHLHLVQQNLFYKQK